MGAKLTTKQFNELLSTLSSEYVIYGPTRFVGGGTFSDTDRIRYGEIKTVEELELNEKSDFSFKEVILPITQTLFYYNEDEVVEAKGNTKKLLIFLRSCDMHAVRRIDEIYLGNRFKDHYYQTFRENTTFIVLGCDTSYSSCFCVDMETNRFDEYENYFHLANDTIDFDARTANIVEALTSLAISTDEAITPQFVSSNEVRVTIPENLSLDIIKSTMWDEYSERCIACGRCNFVCPTCTCFSMQDIKYKDNEEAGERRRVWASCQVHGFTDMAGGHAFRQKNGQKMRFKTLHKVYDFKKRYGYHMCVGCGRCDDICPEYISFSGCINKLSEGMKEVNGND